MVDARLGLDGALRNTGLLISMLSSSSDRTSLSIVDFLLLRPLPSCDDWENRELASPRALDALLLDERLWTLDLAFELDDLSTESLDFALLEVALACGVTEASTHDRRVSPVLVSLCLIVLTFDDFLLGASTAFIAVVGSFVSTDVTLELLFFSGADAIVAPLNSSDEETFAPLFDWNPPSSTLSELRLPSFVESEGRGTLARLVDETTRSAGVGSFVSVPFFEVRCFPEGSGLVTLTPDVAILVTGLSADMLLSSSSGTSVPLLFFLANFTPLSFLADEETAAPDDLVPLDETLFSLLSPEISLSP